MSHQQSALIQLQEAYNAVIAQGREPHDAVVMTNVMLLRLMGCTPHSLAMYDAATASTGMLMGMRLHLSKTFMGAVFHALLLAGIDERKVLLVREDGRCDTVEWNS